MHSGKGDAPETHCSGLSKHNGEKKHKRRDGWPYDADAHMASCAQHGSTVFFWYSKAPLWPGRRLCSCSARLLLHEWLRFEGDTWAACVACPGGSSLTTDHTLFPAKGWRPHSSWEQRDLNYLSLSWIKEASIAATL